VPHNRALGLQAVAADEHGVVSELPFDPKLVGNPETGFLHGGVITSAIDATCGIAVLVRLAAPRRIATLDLRIDYLRPAVSGKNVLCHAHCYRHTSQVAFVRGLAHYGDLQDPIASAAGTFIIFDDVRSVAGRAVANRETP
jgi:uncharacterized protein (TIGR00369 family)